MKVRRLVTPLVRREVFPANPTETGMDWRKTTSISCALTTAHGSPVFIFSFIRIFVRRDILKARCFLYHGSGTIE